MSSGNMLRFLTNKLKSSSLNEVDSQGDDDKDSGTESDDENNDLNDRDSPDCNNEHNVDEHSDNQEFAFHGDTFKPESRDDNPRTHEISDHNFDTISCTSDYERHSLDFDGHSSEDELESITEENITTGQNQTPSALTDGCPSTSSTDEEVKDLFFNPQPVLLRSSPPKGVLKIYTENETTQRMLLRVVTPILSTVSPRKRHRHNATSDPQSDSEGETVIQRPCLDFEKMQQVKRLYPSYFKRCKMSKDVKSQTVL